MNAETPIDLETATKQALRRLAKSVVLITCRHEGRRHAMAATAVDALSMDPPSILACVNRSASIHAPMAQAEWFAVNILGREQEELSHHCSGPVKGEERFTKGRWDDSGPAPVLEDAQAAIVCRRDTSFSYGTHDIFVGRVAEIRTAADIRPLIFVDGRYLGIEAEPVSQPAR